MNNETTKFTYLVEINGNLEYLLMTEGQFLNYRSLKYGDKTCEEFNVVSKEPFIDPRNKTRWHFTIERTFKTRLSVMASDAEEAKQLFSDMTFDELLEQERAQYHVTSTQVRVTNFESGADFEL